MSGPRGRGGQHLGDATPPGAPLPPGPQPCCTPACPPPILLLLATKRQVLSGQGHTPGFPQGRGAQGSTAAGPSTLLRWSQEGWGAGVLGGCRRGGGLQKQGWGRGPPHSWMTGGTDRMGPVSPP